ncbi:MAG: LPS assembly lipoprotein LptE [Thermoguttaceae bacterium]|nr:LPS assembly lipoprotein LptE [Thermoguttaceae bacterium]MDW8077944.1 LptE family protein [Thermoguttaceae bacterium]
MLRKCGIYLALLVLAGCAGYQVGPESLFPAHIRTVYVPIFESDSLRRHLGERLTEAVMKQIELQTPFKVVGTPDADSTLSGRIVAEGKSVQIENRWDEPRELVYRFQVQVRWIDYRGELIREATIAPAPEDEVLLTSTSLFVPEQGHSVAVAQQKAIERLARQIVGMMESPW